MSSSINLSDQADRLLTLCNGIVSEYCNTDPLLARINVEEGKWSLNQIVGHLIDSASNNHQRFIRFTLGQSLEFPDYKRDEWLQAFDYNSMEFKELLQLFLSFNKLIVQIIKSMDPSLMDRRWNIPWGDNDHITLGQLIPHYIWHIEEHEKQFRLRLVELQDIIK